MGTETNSKKVANFFRKLADKIERCRIEDYIMETSYGFHEFEHRRKINRILNGETAIEIKLFLYDPGIDERPKIPEIIHKEEQKDDDE